MTHFICVNPYISPMSFVTGTGALSANKLSSKVPIATGNILGTAQNASLSNGANLTVPVYLSTTNVTFVCQVVVANSNHRGQLDFNFIGAVKETHEYYVTGQSGVTTMRSFLEEATISFSVTNNTNIAIAVFIAAYPGKLQALPNQVIGNTQSSPVLT